MRHQPTGYSRMRRTVALLALAGSICVGGTALGASPTSAAPASTGSVALRQDGLASIAASALEALQNYRWTNDESALAAYSSARDAIAAEVAARLGVDPTRMITAWQDADYAHQTAVMAALTQLGVPYRRNTSREGVGFDCSGLTTYAWGVAGETLVRQSGSQIRAAAPRTNATAMAGDLMYYPGHVMMYLGVDTTMIHSPYTGRSVEVSHLSNRHRAKFGNPIG